MSKRVAVALGAIAVAMLGLVAAGCGGGSASGGRSTAGRDSGQASSQFAWLRPAPAPGGWPVARIPNGAAMAYPPGWRRIKGDVGTATAGLLGPRRQFVGYLNLTPRQGRETLSNWRSYRPEHNSEEGERNVVTLAAAGGLHFRGGRGACVRDTYTTATGARFTELACLVSGARASSVIVGAAPAQTWTSVSPLIEHAISALTT